jgi:hypothetical protein
MTFARRLAFTAMAGALTLSAVACSSSEVEPELPDDEPAVAPAPVGTTPLDPLAPGAFPQNPGGDGSETAAVPAGLSPDQWAEDFCATLATVDTRSRVTERLRTMDPASLDTAALDALQDSGGYVRQVANEMEALADVIASGQAPAMANGQEVAAGYADLVRGDVAVVRSVGEALSNIDPTLPGEVAVALLNQSMFGAVTAGDQTIVAVRRVNTADPERLVQRALESSTSCSKLSLVRGYVKNLDAVN